ncbi:unnamed protein product [Scytosiphon promiscuus]
MLQRPALASIGFAALLGGKSGAQGQPDELNVYNPGSVVVDRSFTLEWESIGQNSFDVVLFADSSSCSGSEPVDLCNESDGCGDSQGDLNLVIPASAGEGEHSILLSLHSDPEVTGCTGGFIVSEQMLDGPSGSSLEVFALDLEDDATIGMELTVEWKYDDGDGRTEGRFGIDLYYGAGCEGTLVADLCGKTNDGELVGCLDSAGDYDVVVPMDIISGEYSIKVGLFGALSPSGCSPTFYIEALEALGVADVSDVGVGIVVPTPWEGYLFPKPECDASIPVEVRYSATSQRVYFEHTDGTTGGCANLTQILDFRQEKNGTVKKIMNASLVTGHWLIEADLYVMNGVTLELHGSASGGDCDALRILSTDTTIHNMRGHGGNLDFMDTIITSWDTGLAVPGVRDTADHTTTEDDTDPRSYIRCAGSARTRPTPRSSTRYGHLGGLWTGNQMHDNEWYGFDPHDDSDYLTIHNNRVWNNGKHGIIASKRCNHVSIQNNEVWDGGETAAGIFLHRSSDSAIVKGNYVHDMQDSGLATLESFDILFANNYIERCKYGVRLSLGAGDNVVSGNTFSDLTSYGFFTYVGSNQPEVPPYDGYRPFGTTVTFNVFNTAHMGKLKQADSSVITGNTFALATVFEVDNSTDTVFTGNTYPDTVEISVKNGACFVAGSDLGDDLGTLCE